MGNVIASVALGTKSKAFEAHEYGDGDRGCSTRNGKRISNSFTSKIPTRFKCHEVDRAELSLYPKKYKHGVGTYMLDPRIEQNTNTYIKVPNCKMPNSCRRDCDISERVYRQVKKQILKLDSQGAARRLIVAGCAWKSSDKSCEGVDCSVYRAISQYQHDQYGRKLERKWAKNIDKMLKSTLGKIISYVPLVGSTFTLISRDISGLRPSSSDWLNFGVDLGLALIPGGGALAAGAKTLAIKTITKAAFKEAAKIGVSQATKRLIIKSAALSIIKNREVQKWGVKSITKALTKQAIRVTFGTAAAASHTESDLSLETRQQIQDLAEDIYEKRKIKAMRKVIDEITKIKPEVYEKIKTKEGESKYTAQQEAKKAKLKKQGKDKEASEIETDLDIKMGFKRRCQYIDDKLEDHCDDGFVYRALNADGSWGKWGVYTSKIGRQRARAENEYYKVAPQLAMRRKLNQYISRHGLTKALKLFKELQVKQSETTKEKTKTSSQPKQQSKPKPKSQPKQEIKKAVISEDEQNRFKADKIEERYKNEHHIGNPYNPRKNFK